MLSRAIHFVCAGVLIGVSGCSRVEPSSSPVSTPRPQADVERKPHYYHKAPPIINDEHPEFKITVPVINDSATTMEVDQVTSLCGCMKPVLASTTIGPGERTWLTLGMNLHGRSGVQKLAAFLHRKSGANLDYVVEVPVFPRARWQREHSSAGVPRHQPQTQVSGAATLELYSSSEADLPSLVSLSTSNEALTVEQLPSAITAIASGLWERRVPINFSLKTPSAAGAYCMSVRAQYTFATEQREVTLDIPGNVISLFEVAPSYLLLGGPTEPGTSRKKVIVRRTDGHPLTLETAWTSANEAIESRVIMGTDRASATVELWLRSEWDGRAVWGEAPFKTNHQKQPTIKIPYAAVSNKI